MPARTSGEANANVAMLREPYQMLAAHCALVSDNHLLGQLRTAPECLAADRVASALGADAVPVGLTGPVVLIDTHHLEPPIAAGSRVYSVHAVVIAPLVDRLKRGATLGRTPCIGLFALFNHQAEVLERAQRAARHARPGLTATVHSDQGCEEDVAVLDLGYAPGATLTFLRTASYNEDGAPAQRPADPRSAISGRRRGCRLPHPGCRCGDAPTPIATSGLC